MIGFFEYTDELLCTPSSLTQSTALLAQPLFHTATLYQDSCPASADNSYPHMLQSSAKLPPHMHTNTAATASG
jgi:hypothetical protein